MMESDAERCASCGSGSLIMQGRVADGRPVRELVCLACKHSWPLEVSPFRGRVRP
jgi:hypothetical protein